MAAMSEHHSLWSFAVDIIKPQVDPLVFSFATAGSGGLQTHFKIWAALLALLSLEMSRSLTHQDRGPKGRVSLDLHLSALRSSRYSWAYCAAAETATVSWYAYYLWIRVLRLRWSIRDMLRLTILLILLISTWCGLGWIFFILEDLRKKLAGIERADTANIVATNRLVVSLGSGVVLLADPVQCHFVAKTACFIICEASMVSVCFALEETAN